MRDVDVAGKRVLVRVDFNIPLVEGRVTDDLRIQAGLPTIRYLVERGARVILTSHLGRPKGKVNPALRLDPIAARLAEVLQMPIAKVDSLTGEEVEKAVGQMRPGEVILLENSRFDPREEANDESLARELASLADIYVNDAFGVAHRAHATTEGVAHLLPAVAGFLLERELEVLDSLLSEPERPFILVLGGAKVADKIGVIERFLDIADAILLGGAACFTFLEARGFGVGASKVEGEEVVATARRAMEKAATGRCELLLPGDVVVADRMAADAETKIVRAEAIPEGWIGLDIGPETARVYAGRIRSAGAVFWNGPMGVFELRPFAGGTETVARAMAESVGVTVLGGGDLAAAARMFGVENRMDHVSTGGGASLDLLEGKLLPGVAVLPDR